jgi:hypothetical protein
MRTANLLQCACDLPGEDPGWTLPGMPSTGLGGAADTIVTAAGISLIVFLAVALLIIAAAWIGRIRTR